MPDSQPDDRWQFWIDVGGTFTDCLARRPDGTLLRRKVLSSGITKGVAGKRSSDGTIADAARMEPPRFWRGYTIRSLSGEQQAVIEDSLPGSINAPITPTTGRGFERGQGFEIVSPEEAPILAIRLFLNLSLDEPIPGCIVRLGTTRGTNALLTRRGAKVGFVTTRGHGDVLRIGYQNRPKLFELEIKKPEPLFAEVGEIDERIAADGTVLQPLNIEHARAELTRLKRTGVESLAICLLNSYANPLHEQQLERLAREAGFTEISLSTQVSPLRKLVPRGDTTVVDAYLNPVLRTYLARLAASLPGSDLRLMTSAGGLAAADTFTGKDSILSGPAGGVVGFSRVAHAAGITKAIGFDMGGTSTDVSRFDGQFEYEHETEKAGVRIVTPMLAIETVAAGGGSICRWDGVKLVVGPESAGADPGPACYGRGGPLTVTDCNFYLGRLLPEHFPFPLDRAAVERRLAEVAEQMRSSPTLRVEPATAVDSPSPTPAEYLAPTECGPTLATGFVRIANANMAQAIRSISLAKGYDPRDYTLVPFGSAGPQHACAVADELGIRTILLHPDAGVLSALGIGLADVVKHRAAGLYVPLDDAGLEQVALLTSELVQAALNDVMAETTDTGQFHASPSVDLRYTGTDFAPSVPLASRAELQATFEREHRRLFGYIHEGRAIEIVAVRARVAYPTPTTLPLSHACPSSQPVAHGQTLIVLDGRQEAVPVFHRERLAPGATIEGPAVIVEELTTTIVDPGWRAVMLSDGELLLTRDAREGEVPAEPRLSGNFVLPSHADPILLELLANHFTAIATQMGITLRNTAISVNVKERLDFSCAIFTAEGDLVVNAPHIPVHLGAMGQTVKQIIADNPRMQPGDAFVTNDPYRGGSHLPDVTVVTPVFSGDSESPAFFTANRAHHAEIGGITPGSMPPFSRNLAEEGVLIRNFKLLDAGLPRWNELRELLTSGLYPSRSPDTNLADLAAQVAANQQGGSDLQRLVERYSLPVVRAYMQHLQDAAERKLRAALARLPPGRREFVDHLDDGTPIRVTVTIAGDVAAIDFTDSGPVSAGNLNANRAIVTAAVMYVLRLLVGEDIPLNQGVLSPVKLVLPEGMLNPPAREQPDDCPAVVGGNVETSQRIVDVLLGAFGLAAASQGTMNNVLFGDATFGYYETICGGSGASASNDGADAVHTHMTNTRLTDPEVLEARFPVRLVEFAIRRGSGGSGQQRGGDGVIRRIEFLKPLTLSILSQRRGPYPPYGMHGGQPGKHGHNTLRRADGTVVELAGAVQIDVAPGDVLAVETPGGGGWGQPLK
jgi:5-oxoprolinase (ATP-hydrolysing)